MRKPFVAGNWKMNKNIAETRELLSAMKNSLNEVSGVEKVVCPPFISLAAAAEMLAGSEIGWARRIYIGRKKAHSLVRSRLRWSRNCATMSSLATRNAAPILARRMKL
jgi:hypothetical protein